MTTAHWHLVLNHAPLFGLVMGIILYLWGLLRKNTSYQKFGLTVFVITSLVTIPAYYTGEGAEHAVEDLAGSSHHMIHEHEELAETAFILTNVLGVLSLLALIMMSRAPEKMNVFTRAMILILSIFTLVIMVMTAGHGGKIRRPELRDPDKPDVQRIEHEYQPV